MIDPRELRLGNIVGYTRNLPGEDKYYTVYNILRDDLMLQSSTDRFSVDIKNVRPVLLTDGILPLCGFDPLKTKPQNQWYHNRVEGFSIDKEVESQNDLVFKWYMYKARNEYIYLETVHQLQNLFFALYGKELHTSLI